MDVKGRVSNSRTNIIQSEEDMDLRRGPWTVDEDLALINYIANHGEGRWNSLARSAGNYLLFLPFLNSLMVFLVFMWKSNSTSYFMIAIVDHKIYLNYCLQTMASLLSSMYLYIICGVKAPSTSRLVSSSIHFGVEKPKFAVFL